MSYIGIFWFYKDTVFGELSSIENGFQGVPGLIDAHATHVKSWEENQSFSRIFPELIHYDYENIPRGRVLYQTRKGKFLVYLDRCLMTADRKVLIAEFFGFTVAQADWKTDLHYTTDNDSLNRIFGFD